MISQRNLEVITLRPRQDLGEASKRQGEADAALLLPRGEASASSHTSLAEMFSLIDFSTMMTMMMKRNKHNIAVIT